MTARFEEFNVICAYLAEGIDTPEYNVILEALNQADPDDFVFFQPDTILAYFVTKKNGAVRSTRAIELFKGLKAAHPKLAPLKTGTANGKLFGDFAWFGYGRLKSTPVGDAIVEAQKRAREAV